MECLMPQRKGAHIEEIIMRAILQHFTLNNAVIHLAAILVRVQWSPSQLMPFSPVISIHLSVLALIYRKLIFNREGRICKCTNWI